MRPGALCRMKKVSLLLIFALLVAVPIVPTGRGHITVAVYNAHIQTYRGVVGRWVSMNNETIRGLAAAFCTTSEKILEVNGGSVRGSYAFIPMGEAVYRALLQKGQ